MLGAFTGSSMLGLTLISTSNHLWLEFYSDTEATGEGFKLVYSSTLLHCTHFCTLVIKTPNKVPVLIKIACLIRVIHIAGEVTGRKQQVECNCFILIN